MDLSSVSDARIKELYECGGMVRFSLLSVAACEGKEQTERVNRICGISPKDRIPLIIEALSKE